MPEVYWFIQPYSIFYRKLTICFTVNFLRFVTKS